MSEGLFDNSFIESIRSEDTFLRAAITDCRKEAGIANDQPVSVISVELGSAVIFCSNLTNYRNISGYELPIGGLLNRISSATGRDFDRNRSFKIDYSGSHGTAPYRFYIEGSSTLVRRLSLQDNVIEESAVIDGSEKLIALQSVNSMFKCRMGSTTGTEAYDIWRQRFPTTTVEGLEAMSLQPVAAEVLSSTPFGNPWISEGFLDTTTRWVMNSDGAPAGLEADRVWAWNNGGISCRMGIDVAFRTNLFGDGEELVIAIGADYDDAGKQSAPKLYYYETFPKDGDDTDEYRPIPLGEADRAAISGAVRAQIRSDNLSYRRPYA